MWNIRLQSYKNNFWNKSKLLTIWTVEFLFKNISIFKFYYIFWTMEFPPRKNKYKTFCILLSYQLLTIFLIRYNIISIVENHQEIAIEVKSKFLTSKFLSCIKNNKKLSALTGLSSFSLLETIEKSVIRVQSMSIIFNASVQFNLE